MLVLLLALCSCGGGGGGGEPDPLSTNPADVTLTISSGHILVGDRLAVRSELSDIHINGIVVKWRVPRSMVRVSNTELLTLPGDQKVQISPMLDDEKGDFRYIVYVFPSSTFDKNRRARIDLQLRATKPIDDALVELDVDIFDTSKPPSKQFDLNRPLFGAMVVKGLDITKR
jgi:hypothetical protein